MAQPAAAPPSLTQFKALSFDCYGTLIDWEAGILKTLEPFLAELPAESAVRKDPRLALRRLNEHSDALERERPTMPYNELLDTSLARLCAEMGVDAGTGTGAEPFGDSPGSWTAFPDTVEALQRLGRRYKLAILSNVHNGAIERTVGVRLAPARLDAVYTAEDIGSYKPDHANFRRLFDGARRDLGVDAARGELLHVARSLTADHVPAAELGLPSVWICRGGDRPGGYGAGGDYAALRDRVAFGWKFGTLGEFADEVERQFAEEEAGLAGAKAGDAEAGDAEAGDAKPGDVKVEEADVGGAKSGEVKVEDAKTEDAKSGEVKVEEAKTDEVKTEYAKSGEAKTEEVKVEEVQTNGVKTEEPEAKV